MVDFVDLQYAQMLSSRLDRFRIRSTNPYKINFRCPLCGDSEKSRSKARGWLLEKENSFYYYCHNCGASQSFSWFLKGLDNGTYQQWVADKFYKKANNTIETTKFEQPVFRKKSKDNPLKKLKKVSQLRHDHAINRYIKQRQIPSNTHYKLYWAPQFKSWINSIIPDKFDNVDKDEARLVLPFLDEHNQVFGVSARGFKPDGIRYITIMFEDRPKIFGLDTVDFNRRYFVVEGAIDSLFLKNSVAMAGADGNVNGMKNLEKAVFVFDAEPRNKEIGKRMERIINSGYQICIWPKNLPGKDINEMILGGVSNVKEIVESNIYKGLEAKLKFAEWRKV
jgi:transcription elongation factor Elf1